MTPARLIVSFGGIGFAPAAPGTVGSFAALVLGAAALHGPVWLLPLMAAAATLAGLAAIPYAISDRNADPGWIVIDEVAGQWIVLLGLAGPTPLALAAAFLLFRVLDIWKPGPVGWADRQRGAIGIMLDDVLAGLIGAAILLVLRMAGWGGSG